MGRIRYLRLLFCLTLFLFSLAFVSSAHWITGYANDALDGESANNHVVVIWNPENGKTDNLTDIIGVNGNSAFDHVYMFDCEMLGTPCSVGAEMRVEIIDSGDSYVSNYTSVFVSPAGYDMVDNLTINSKPVATINYPAADYIGNDVSVDFNCSFDDLDSVIGEISLYGNFSGAWGFVEKKAVSGSSAIFTRSLNEGFFEYSCYAYDGLVGTFSENRTLRIDRIDPNMNSLILNESFFCGDTAARGICNTDDVFGILEVVMQVKSPSSTYNVSSVFLSAGDYYSDFTVDEKGDWSLICYAKDNAGNLKLSSPVLFEAFSGLSELSFVSEEVFFSNPFPIEYEQVNVSVNISNPGCVTADNFIVSFYDGDPDSGGVQVADNVSLSISAFSSVVAKSVLSSVIGINNIFVLLDSSEVIFEENEGDNKYNNSFSVLAWQEFYGSIEAVKILKSSVDFGAWGNDSNLEGNVFMADSESQISWLDLVALGQTRLGGSASDDFSEVDSLLGMGGYVDSISSVYALSSPDTLIVHQKNIGSISVVQSTDNDNFKTGILWDSADDSNGEFDSIEKEDLVFVSNINRDAVGKYGTYDYEIKIPAKLREYDSLNVQDVYFYYELI